MHKKTLTVFTCIVLLICTVFTSFLFPIQANADDYTSATSIKDRAERIAYKLWSVGKAAGMTDEECAGMIDNALGESGLDAEAVEAWDGAFEFDDRTITDRKEIADWCWYTISEVFPNYTHEEYTDEHGHTAEAHSGGKSISISGYIMEDGHFGPGIGMFQWTGSRASKLKSFAQSKGLNWYDEDLQILFMFNLKEHTIQDGKAEWIRDTYVQSGKTTMAECSNLWTTGFEVISATSGSLRRETETTKYYNKFKGSYGDTDYGIRILQKAGFPIKLPNGNRTIVDKSLINEIIGTVIVLPMNSGFAFDVNGSADDYAKTAATALLRSMDEYSVSPDQTVDVSKDPALAKKYSLYDLFGSDIHWYRYMGEATAQVKLLDHVYSAYSQEKMGLLTLGDTVFYESNRFLSTKVYNKRPKVLSVQDVNDGKYDPRVTTYQTGQFNGTSYVAGSFFMNIAKLIVGLVGFLMGPTIINALRDVVLYIFSADFWPKVLVPVVLAIVSLAMVFFILSLAGKVRKFVVGQSSKREVIKRFVYGFISIAIITAFAFNPGAFVNATTKLATLTDSIFNSALTASYTEDDVIGSTDGTKTVEAMLWKTAIFEPWCIGQFGDRYDHLYTQYATDLKSGQSRMEQSHYFLEKKDTGDYKKQKDIDAGDIEYSSATYTGDVLVPVGNNVYIRNWAAYLYSCQSKYHIDQTYITGAEDVPSDIKFPNRLTTAYNSEIAADTFRVIDAQMDISPQIYTDKIINSYTSGHLLEDKFTSQSMCMIIYSIILAVSFIPAICQKLYSLLRLFLIAVQGIFLGIKELAKEGDGLSHILTEAKEFFLKYLLAALRLFVLIELYYKLVGQSMLQTIFYCILTIGVYSVTVDSIRRTAQSVPRRIRTYSNNLRNHV